MFFLFLAIHVIVSIFLIAVILLQAGKGGGLSDVFGGGSSSTIFGTKAGTFLTRATIAAAVIFIVTSLTLAVMSAHKSRSLMDLQRTYGPSVPTQTLPVETPAE